MAVLSFLIPWISNTIEEPFKGRESFAETCPTSTGTLITLAPPQATSLADTIELGRQRYNPLNLLQWGRDRRVFADGTLETGSLDTTLIPGAPTDSNTALKRLNNRIRNAFQTVDIVPRIWRGDGTSNGVRLNDDGTFQANGGFLSSWSGNGSRDITQDVVSYVEERLPPRDTRLDDAATCEVNNMYYRKRVAAGTDRTGFADARSAGTELDRAGMCALLDTDSTNPNRETTISGAFGSDTSKICGVCIKDAKPVSETTVHNPGSKEYNGIGGLFLSQADKLLDESYGRKPQPSYGTCAEGYFFLPGQKTDCLKAAQRLNCEELEKAGGFGKADATSKDRTTIMNSECRACTNGTEVNYAYYKSTGTQSVRVRVVVPTGTGRTVLKVAVGTNAESTYTLIATKSDSGNTSVSLDSINSSRNSNTAYFTVNANPGDILKITAYQEFPHRPRGKKEVFFVKRPASGYETDAQFVNSLDCEFATPAQLDEAKQINGMNVCEVGIASDGRKYIVRQDTVNSANPFSTTGEGTCPTVPSLGGKQEITDSAIPATGVWVYGYKPAQSHLASSDTSILPTPFVANSYTYYKLTNETNVSDAMKQSRYYSDVSLNSVPNPCYRGICIQLEKNSETINRLERINVPAENHFIKVNELDIRNMLLTVKLQKYSRNGRFNDSERIITPKPSTTATSIYNTIEQTQYWIWSPLDGSAQSNKFSCEIDIPAFFTTPTHSEDQTKCMNSPLYDNELHLNRATGTPCDGGLDDNDQTGCIAYCFMKAGGTENGTLHPMKSPSNRLQLLYKDYDEKNTAKRLREPRTADEIVAFLIAKYVNVMKGENASFESMTALEIKRAMNAASQALIGEDVVKPCYELQETSTGYKVVEVNTIEKVDEVCLDSIYRNTTVDPVTYANMAPSGAYSGLIPDEYKLANDDDKNAYPYKACQPSGTWAPLGNAVAVEEIKNEMKNKTLVDGMIARARAVFNDIYQKANEKLPNTPTNSQIEEQELALNRCYGINKKTYITNCNGIPTKSITIYKLGGTSNTMLNDTEWKIVLTREKGTDILIKYDASDKAYVKENKPVDVYDLTGFIPSNSIEFPGITFSDTKPFSSLQILRVTTGGEYIGTHTLVKPTGLGTARQGLCPSGMLEYGTPVGGFCCPVAPTGLSSATGDYDVCSPTTANLCALDSARTQSKPVCAGSEGADAPVYASFFEYPKSQTHGTSDTVRKFIIRYDSASDYWKMIEVELKNEASKLKVKITGVKHLSKLLSVSGTPKEMWDNANSQRFTSTTDAINGIATSDDATDIRSKGYGIKFMKVAFDDSQVKPFYTLKSSPQTITAVEIEKIPNTRALGTDPFLVVLRDEDGVAAQKRLLPTSSVTKASLNFLQEDIRPLIFYEPSKIKTGYAFRLESAVGKRFFLQSTGVIAELPTSSTTTTEQDAESRTKFILKDASSLSGPTNRIATTTAPTQYLTLNMSTNTVTAENLSATATNANVDWSIVPAINGAYAFVSVMSVNTPGFCIVAEKNATGSAYTAKAKLVNKDNDVEAFHACWRLYPAI